MVIEELHIELKIYHFNRLTRYDVIQTLKGGGEVNFKVLYHGEYVFTLVFRGENGVGFQLSQLDKDLDIAIDWKLYSKIEASLFSVFLNEIPS